MRLRFALLALLACPLGARAQAAPDTVVALGPVTVMATRAGVVAAAAPARVEVVGAAALERSGAADVGALLAARTGTQVRRHGPGGLASPSLRGAGPARTLVLLDGMRLADPQLGQVDLSLLPTALLGGVEVLHGAASALHGSDALGGVVDLRPRTPGAATARLGIRGGAWGERGASVVLAHGGSRWSALVAADAEQGENDYRYVDARAIRHRAGRRAHAASERQALYASLARRTDGATTRVGAWLGRARRELPGPLGLAAQGEHQDDDLARLWLRDERRLGRTRVTSHALAQHTRLAYRNAALGIDDTGRTRRLGAGVAAQRLAGRWLVDAGVEGAYADAAHPAMPPRARLWQTSLWTSAMGGYGRWLLYPALRLDVADGAGGARMVASPRLGLNVRLVRGLRLKGSLARAFRAPTLNDLYWRSAGARGNPALRPERGWTADAGLHHAGRGVEVEATLFVSRLADRIVWAPGAAGYAPENVSRVHSRGLEATARAGARLGRRGRIDIEAGYTLTDARDRSEPSEAAWGQPLRYVARHAGRARVDVRRGAWAAGAGVHALGGRPLTTDGSPRAEDRLPAHAEVRAQLAWEGALRGLRLRAALHLENALDARYEIVEGYPMPPRHGRLLLALTL